MRGVRKATRQGQSVGDVCERGGSVRERKKKKDEPDHGITPRIRERKGTACADSTKGRPPSVCEQKGPSAPVREKEGSAGKKKRRTRAPRMRLPLVFAQEGAPVHL
jgi:hypothetical protein